MANLDLGYYNSNNELETFSVDHYYKSTITRSGTEINLRKNIDFTILFVVN